MNKKYWKRNFILIVLSFFLAGCVFGYLFAQISCSTDVFENVEVKNDLNESRLFVNTDFNDSFELYIDFDKVVVSNSNGLDYLKEACLLKDNVWVEPFTCYDRNYLIGLSKALDEVKK